MWPIFISVSATRISLESKGMLVSASAAALLPRACRWCNSISSKVTPVALIILRLHEIKRLVLKEVREWFSTVGAIQKCSLGPCKKLLKTFRGVKDMKVYLWEE